jgi:indole-3-glycerol phosphate synthase
MKSFLDRIIETKKQEVEQLKSLVSQKELEYVVHENILKIKDKRDFYAALSENPEEVRIIAEIKKASPSKGNIRPDLDPGSFASEYEKGGASAVSVLTEKDYFLGSPEDLMIVRSSCSIPVLRKDFIFCDYQIYEACAMRADAVLIIARILEKDQIRQLCDLCFSLEMEPLVEIHSAEDVPKISGSGARLVLINNRDLGTFKTSLDVAIEMKNMLEPGQIPITASGINSRADIEKNIEAGITRFLVGESIVRSDDRAGFIRTLRGFK